MLKKYEEEFYIFLISKGVPDIDMVKHELRVESLKARFEIQNCKLPVQIHELRVQIYELRVQMHELWVHVHESLNQWKLK